MALYFLVCAFSRVRESIMKRADINQGVPKHYGYTPLTTASMHGYLEVVQFLVSSDADINKATHDGRTPACSDTMCCSNRRHTW